MKIKKRAMILAALFVKTIGLEYLFDNVKSGSGSGKRLHILCYKNKIAIPGI
jgi:hypothetical protein